MLNKLQFNNLIISNKKCIQRCRTQTINKLVQKIRKFKLQLEKEPENGRTRSRLRKATEIINYLKKIKPVEIIKNILLLKRSPGAIITDGLSSPDETGNALLALNKTIQNLIKTFRETLNLSDSSCKWKDDLIETSKRRSKKNKTELRKKNRKDVKEQKAIARKRLEWIKENNLDAVIEQDSDLSTDQKVVATVGQWKIESIQVEKSTILKKKNADVSQNTHEAIKERHLGKVTEFEKIKKFKKNNANEMENTYAAQKRDRKKNQTNSDRSSIELKPVVTHVVDPFFFTETGENYLSTAVTSQGEQASSIANTQNMTPDYVSGLKIKVQDDNRSKPNSWKNINSKEPEQTNDDQNLHPSWSAKRKKSFVTEFQGKKITFDDNEANGFKEIRKTKKIAKHETNEELEKLHPSWIAKQKMKSNIQNFQGKKISFTNFSDED